MDATKKVSLVIPVYNTERYLPELRESLDKQGDSISNIILVDDGSTDRSANYLKAWKSEDTRVHLIQQQNSGQSVARNRGIDYLLALDDAPAYVMFIDSDDMIAPHGIESLLLDVESRDLDMLEFSGRVFFETNELAERFSFYSDAYKRTRSTLSIENGIDYLCGCFDDWDFLASPCMRIMRLSLLAESRVRFFEGVIHEDNLFTCQCLISAKRVSYNNGEFYLRRIRGGSTVTSACDEKKMEGYFRCAYELTCYLDSIPDLSSKKIMLFKKYIDSLYAGARKSLPTDGLDSWPMMVGSSKPSAYLAFQWHLVDKAKMCLDWENDRAYIKRLEHDLVVAENRLSEVTKSFDGPLGENMRIHGGDSECETMRSLIGKRRIGVFSNLRRILSSLSRVVRRSVRK